MTGDDLKRPTTHVEAHSGRAISELEAIAINRVERAGLPAPVREHRFANPRKWAFDLAYPDHMIAVELEGGVYSGGRHVRGEGFTADCRKYGEAAARGWLVIRCTRDMVESGEMVVLIRRTLALAQVEEVI